MYSTVVNVADKYKIEGESILSGYEGWIDAVAIRHEIDLPMTQDKSSNSRTSGRPNLKDLELVMLMNKAYPKFLEACGDGKNLGEVKLKTLRVNEGKLNEISTFIFGNVYVSSVSVNGGPASAVATQNIQLDSDQQNHPLVTVRLNYDQISCSYAYTENNGVQKGTIASKVIKATA